MSVSLAKVIQLPTLRVFCSTGQRGSIALQSSRVRYLRWLSNLPHFLLTLYKSAHPHLSRISWASSEAGTQVCFAFCKTRTKATRGLKPLSSKQPEPASSPPSPTQPQKDSDQKQPKRFAQQNQSAARVTRKRLSQESERRSKG